MTAIYVCPLSRLAETVAGTGARHVVTLINNETLVARPPSIDVENHLFLGINDICDPEDGMVCPAEHHVEEFLGFVRRWDQRTPVVIHCYAGISRSTAAAFSAYCAMRPDLDEATVAFRMRQRSPEATPNARIVQMADSILRREGRMIHAVEQIGRGIAAYEGTVFALHLDE
ncbi:MAG: tyrosine phosphatase family protein [Propylenella sp.]